MINVVLWLGKTKHSDDLAIIFARNNIRIVDEHFDNNDDFIDRFDALDTNVDVLVIADTLLLNTDRKKPPRACCYAKNNVIGTIHHIE